MKKGAPELEKIVYNAFGKLLNDVFNSKVYLLKSY